MVRRMRPPDPITLSAVAEALAAPVCGDGSVPLRRLVHPAEATEPTDLVMVLDPRLAGAIGGSPIRAAVLASGIVPPAGALAGWIVVPRPRLALSVLLELFARPPHAPPGVHPTAAVDPAARLGDGVSIGPFAYVGPNAEVGAGSRIMAHVSIGADARIGTDCLLYPGVRVGERVVVGDRVILHHNVSLGADGFSFVSAEPAGYEIARGDTVDTPMRDIRRIGSIGTVVIGDDVEIGANSAVDRANIGATVIGRGTKIDNQVQVGHNARIGEDCLISGQAGISGSVRIGNRVVIAGQAGIADHVTIGDDAVVGGSSGVGRDVPAGRIVMGTPAVSRSLWRTRLLAVGRAGRLLRELAALRRRTNVEK
ncbi:UDP-3-O-[3-hydroxymyristoyl] glucosamine N-acyltransferase [Constrictibacter sp. MBR-5]|jgi:UDP-3-O-[3-hydroxymyristoyl] glucosamine N-acyltransferase